MWSHQKLHAWYRAPQQGGNLTNPELLPQGEGFVPHISLSRPWDLQQRDEPPKCLVQKPKELTSKGPKGLCELKMPPAISVNKGCCSHQAVTLQLPPTVSPEGTQDRGKICPPSSSQLLQPPPTMHPEETQDEKHRILAPDSWGAYQRNDFSEPRICIFPYMEKH